MREAEIELTLADAPGVHRYEARLGDDLAGSLTYRLVGTRRIVLIHTEVEPAHAGRGVGSRLASFALDDARARGLGVVPLCPFVVSYLQRHREHRDLIVSRAGTCLHLGQIRDVQPSGDGCQECLRIGGRWVRLRLCRTCGQVGCCDSSPNRHASAHAAEHGHPIVRSLEPGETWSWCYVDQAMLEDV